MDRIITFFRPPVFDDEDKTFSTGLLYTCLNFEWPFLVLYCLYVLTNRQNPLRFLVGLVFLVLIFSLMAATRRGHIKAVSVIFVSICYTLLTLMTFFLSHGVEDTAYIAGTFSLLIIIGLILSWKFLSVFTGVVVFTTLAMAFAEAAGLKPLPIGPRDEITAALILSFISIQSAFLLGFSAYKLQSALNQYRKVLSERKRAEMEVQRQADNLEAVNRLSIELAQTGLDDDIYALITGRMRETFNALAVTVSIFDSALTSMVLKQISIREGMVAMAYQLFERRLEHMTMWVNPQQLDTMKTTHITRLASISELTFGAIPETLSQTAGVLFGIKEIYVCILQHHEELIGSMAIILGEDSEIFDEITVEAMLQVFSIAIRRRLAEENLRLSEDRFRSIALKGYDVIIVINLEGIITYESPSASRILGMQPGSLSGQSVYSLIHPDDVSEAQLKIEKTARLGEEDVSGMPHEYRIRHARGEWVYFEAIALNLLKRPSVKGIVITAHDIGERKRADLEIQALNASLEQRVTERTNSLNQVNRDLEAFTYSVSHDLRAPLRTIKGFSQVLEEDYADSLPADARILIDRIDASASRMNTLIDDLLVFARLGRQAINKQTLQPVILIQSVLKEMEAETAGRKVDFQIEDLPECEADPSLLKQVWVNLVSNALKYSRHEEETHITIGSLLPPGSSVPVYFIRDNGVGFDMQYAEKLFGVFQRLHSTGEFEGTGVGLAIVQSIIQHHGGRIWAEAEVNQGATFYFTLA